MTLSKKIKWTLASIVLVLFSLPLGGLIYFLYSNDAPVTRGNVAFGIPYNTDASLTLDIYSPTRYRYEKSPVVLFIHGGAWIAGTKEAININRINGAINQLRDLGYTIVSPNYSLATASASPFPHCIKDGFEAIQWTVEHGDSLNLDLTNFGIIGESAGGHIAMMNTFAAPADFGLPLEKVLPGYLIDIYGPNDLLRLYHSQLADSLRSVLSELPYPIQEKLDLATILFGFDPEEDSLKTRTFAAQYSPIQYLNETQPLPPVLIIHGKEDLVVPVEQSIFLKARLDTLQASAELHLLDSVNHAFAGASETQKDSIQHWIVNFVVKQYH